VKWPDIEQVAEYTEVLEISDVIKEYEALD
jgi:hypothetical protein